MSNSSPPPPPEPTSEETKSTIKTTNTCQVCGDNATIINYGALSCLSCRTFFRRNAYHRRRETPSCRFNGNCQVTISTRKLCTACRLAKCLAVGMSPELIRKEDLSVRKRKQTKLKAQQRTSSQTSTVNSSQTSTVTAMPSSHLNSSTLTNPEWNMISNVVHAFDTFSPVARVRQTMEIITGTASTLRFDLTQSLNFLKSFYQSLRSFISSTPDFKVLTSTEQSSLFQRNMLGLLALGGMHFMRDCQIFEQSEFEMAIIPLFGQEQFQRAKKISQQLDSDPTLVKLLLIALAFSSNCSTVEGNTTTTEQDTLLLGTFRLFGSQNVYLELIWKYLIHRYGNVESIQRFSNLIKSLLDTLKFFSDIYENNSVFQQFLTDRLQQDEQSTNLSESLLIPLWGKQ